VGSQYKPMEVTKGDWDSVRRGPPHAIDAWGLGKWEQKEGWAYLACWDHSLIRLSEGQGQFTS